MQSYGVSTKYETVIHLLQTVLRFRNLQTGRKQRMAFGLILALIGIAFAVWIADKMI